MTDTVGQAAQTGSTPGLDTAGTGAKFDEMLAKQMEVQQMATSFNIASTNLKTQFDVEKSGVERFASVAESVSQLANQQSQQITQ